MSIKENRLFLLTVLLAYPNFMLHGDGEKHSLPSGVSVLIEAEKNLVLGDPVHVSLMINNNSKDSFSLLKPDFRHFQYETIRFYTRSPGENTAKRIQFPDVYDGPAKSMSPPKSIDVATVAPGQSAVFDFVLTYDFPEPERRRWLFPVAGKYAVKCDIFIIAPQPRGKDTVAPLIPTTTYQTEEAFVEIGDLTQGTNRSAFSDLGSLKYDYLIYAPDQFRIEQQPRAKDEINAFVNKHSNSKFADFGNLFLAHVSLAEGVAHSDKKLLNSSRRAAQDLINKGTLPFGLQQKAQMLIDLSNNRLRLLPK